MSNIIVNAPIQNRDFSPDCSRGKIIPVLVADWLRMKQHGPDASVVDLWNDVLAGEAKVIGVDSGTDYVDIMKSRTEDKYNAHIMKDRMYQYPKKLSDTSTGFGKWVTEVLEKSMEDGDVAVETHDLNVCAGCDGSRNFASKLCDHPCPDCDSTETIVQKRKILAAHVDSEALKLVALSAKESTHGSRSEKILISKRRVGGIGLECIGLENQHLDPKVGMVLLPIYAATAEDVDSVGVVASRASSTHNLSRGFSVIKGQISDMPALKMLPIAKAPVDYVRHLGAENILSREAVSRILINVLPPYLLSMKQDMSPATLNRIVFGKGRTGIDF